MSARPPRVSVVIPAHDASATIAATLASVAAQRFADWEAVVADDASADDTAAIVAAWGDDRVRLVRATANGGPARARNLALAHARGELVAFLDADDRWLPGYLEALVGAYDREQARTGDVGIVCCDAWVEDEGGRRAETYRASIGAPEDVTLATLLRANVIFVSALAPRAAVLDAGGFDVRTFGSEDHDLWLKLVERGLRVVTVPQPLAVYRVHAASVSANPVRMAVTAQATYRLALARGRLRGRARRIARRQLDVHRAVAALERPGGRRPRVLLGAAIAFGAEALARPAQWRGWIAAVAAGRVRPWRRS